MLGCHQRFYDTLGWLINHGIGAANLKPNVAVVDGHLHLGFLTKTDIEGKKLQWNKYTYRIQSDEDDEIDNNEGGEGNAGSDTPSYSFEMQTLDIDIEKEVNDINQNSPMS